MPGSPATTLTGLRVLDLSSNLAGPLAAMVLGDLGADVIKVERAGSGDDTRALHPRWDGDSTVFHSVNRGKRSVELDLASAAGQETLLALAERSDVLIESFGPGVASKLGVDFPTVAARSPRIIYGSVSAFGSGAVGSRLPGYDSLIQAFSGMISITGEPDGAPVRVAPSAIDLSTGLWLVVAIMAALRQREWQPAAQHLEVALVDSAFNLMSHQILGLLATGVVPGPLGAGSPSTMPNGAFTAADGWLVVATGNEAQWHRLCDALQAPDIAEDPRFATIADRIAARDELQAELDSRFRVKTVDSWIERLEAARVPVGRIQDLREAIEHPLMTERGLLTAVRPDVAPAGSDYAEPLPQLRLPIDPAAEGIHSPPPRLGQHTQEVLRELEIATANQGRAEPDSLVGAPPGANVNN
jgi:crotonobetainyl-CoA:carnitine CoA-transferase CaiB-like acyl-CoA transferase